MSVLRGFFEPFPDLSPAMTSLGDPESIVTRLRYEEAVAEQYLARNLPGVQQASGNNESGNVYWLPGTGNPTGDPANVKSDALPLLRALQSRTLCPGALRQMRGAPLKERGMA